MPHLSGFFLSSTGFELKSLTLARQVLYHLTKTPPALLSDFNIILLEVCLLLEEKN
jgi:hypothetical protein